MEESILQYLEIFNQFKEAGAATVRPCFMDSGAVYIQGYDMDGDPVGSVTIDQSDRITLDTDGYD